MISVANVSAVVVDWAGAVTAWLIGVPTTSTVRVKTMVMIGRRPVSLVEPDRCMCVPFGSFSGCPGHGDMAA